MPTIFLVEDNPADVDLFRMALRDARVECDVVLFEDGSEIIDHIRKPDPTSLRAAPDLIVLDLNLPKSDGLEVLQVVRDSPSFAQVTVAVLSSSSSARERAKVAAFHIREFIVKPPSMEAYLDIGKIVRSLLDEAKTRNGAAL